MQNIRGLLFDKDGTLFDFQATWGVHTHGLINRLAGPDPMRRMRLAEALGFDMDRRLFRPESAVIAGSFDVMMACIHTALPDLNPLEVTRLVLNDVAAAEQVPAAPLGALLSDLRAAGYALGVATNDAERPAYQHLEAAGVGDAFDFVAGCDSGFGAKPEPGMLLGFAAALDLAPTQILMIGDSTHDLHAAEAAGMPALGVLTGVAGRTDLAPYAIDVLDSIADLPAWLRRRNATLPVSQTTMP